MESSSDATLGAKDYKHTFWPSDVLIFYPFEICVFRVTYLSSTYFISILL